VAITYTKGADAAALVIKEIECTGNNAGTAIPKTFEETTLEEMDHVIDINIRGVFVATQAALKHLPDGGRIITIGSAVGERVWTPGLVPYAATKGAVKIFTQGLAREVGSRGITVNNVQPGPIDTDLNPANGDWAVPQKAVTGSTGLASSPRSGRRRWYLRSHDPRKASSPAGWQPFGRTIWGALVHASKTSSVPAPT
jgi:3-oxoacyl-[acyl-carrier protein] reductase